MLVSITVGGVQQFIAESRTTADLRNGSAMYSALAGQIAGGLAALKGDVVFPAIRPSTEGMPNRIVAVIQGNDVAATVDAVVTEARLWWQHQAVRLLDAPAAVLPPPISWVAAPEVEYSDAWATLGRLAVARKRTRTFVGYNEPTGALCSLSGRFPAGTERDHLRRRERLSDVCWMKRLWERGGFPSTRAILAGAYQYALTGRLDGDRELASHALDLADSVDLVGTVHSRTSGVRPRLDSVAQTASGLGARIARLDGSWFDPLQWTEQAVFDEHGAVPDASTLGLGRDSAAMLSRRAVELGLVGLPTHLAIVAHDVDEMGRRLSEGPADALRQFHGQVSSALVASAETQRRAVEDAACGRLVYSGGDDALAFVPAAEALTVAENLRSCVLDSLAVLMPRVTVSSAIVFFPADYPLQRAVRRAQTAVQDSKHAGRDRLTIVHLNGGGERAAGVARWVTGDRLATRQLADLASARVNGRAVAADLLADRNDLAASSLVLDGEVERRVGRRSEVGKGRAGPLAAELVGLCDDGPSGGSRAHRVIEWCQVIGELEELSCL